MNRVKQITLDILFFVEYDVRRAREGSGMKEFSQYTSVEDVVRDLIADGVFSRNRKVREMFPSVVTRSPRKNHNGPLKHSQVDRLKLAIVEAIKNRPLDVTMSHYKLARAVRSDNHPDEFVVAIQRLIEERKITREIMQTGKPGRPFVHYNLFEF